MNLFPESKVYRFYLHGWKHPSIGILKCFRKLKQDTGLCASLYCFGLLLYVNTDLCMLYILKECYSVDLVRKT